MVRVYVNLFGARIEIPISSDNVTIDKNGTICWWLKEDKPSPMNWGSHQEPLWADSIGPVIIRNPVGFTHQVHENWPQLQYHTQWLVDNKISSEETFTTCEEILTTRSKHKQTI